MGVFQLDFIEKQGKKNKKARLVRKCQDNVIRTWEHRRGDNRVNAYDNTRIGHVEISWSGLTFVGACGGVWGVSRRRGDDWGGR